MMMPTMCADMSWNGVSRLILGSKSWSRNTLLQQMNPPPFDVIAPEINEEQVVCNKTDACDVVLKIALAKARTLIKLASITKRAPLTTTMATTPQSMTDDDDDEVHEKEEEHEKEGRILMICGDAVVVHKGKIMGKPKDEDEARELLASYADAPVTTVSSIVVVDVDTKRFWADVDEAEVYFRELPKDVVDKVIKEGGMQSAGALRIEMPDVQPYVDCVVGDLSAVMGFSQPLLARLVNSLLVEESEGTKL